MVTIRETAKAYEPPMTLNITDLPQVNIDDLDVQDREGRNQDNEVFKYKSVVVEGREYRIPNSVIEEIQKIINLKPDIKLVKVTKTGSGLGTRYQVRPI